MTDVTVDRIAALLVAAFRSGNKLLIVGNGGSAADAQHIAAELMGRYKAERVGLPAIALVDPAVVTAIANDYGFNQVFVRQVIALGKPGDVLLAISTSGQSENVLAAIIVARTIGVTVIGLTGSRQMANACHLAYVSYGETAGRIQEDYMVVAHEVCGLVEAAWVKAAA